MGAGGEGFGGEGGLRIGSFPAPICMKALAMAGAWFGLAALPILLGAFLVSAVAYAILANLIRRGSGVVPTGPAHLAASLVFLLYARVF